MQSKLDDLPQLMKQANKVYLDNFPAVTNFERAIFFSWYCDIRDCKFCYMSTQPKDQEFKQKGRRTTESLLAETLLIKHLKWDFGFLSGGKGAYDSDDFVELVKKIHIVLGEKIWINIGPLKKEELKQLQPYVKGVVGSIETVNKKVHDFVCPSKPIEPYLEMFQESTKLGMDNAITIILGLGETEDDFPALKEMIEKHNISKIHFYGLNPHKDTSFEDSEPPTKQYQAWWIAKTRIECPKIDIQMGIWEDRVNRVSYLLDAGANSISKYPALKVFGKESAYEIEKECQKARRTMRGTLTKLPKIDWDMAVEELTLDQELKSKIKIKLKLYLKKMEKNLK
ncbi:radical SAM protein [Candidatus Woesearchaeota archaeon]|jgi:biotin synthase-like enzyme|nr:radical SAM protein [Candidatus Woesearchaeota archaeon]MBT5273056.1 radical SAM protein [Candidatus Woesearchaeota archaeon]MBT6040808.1 radical SAM protein [Candidatus Woesearchaeota archaeon]MBT6337629.1 radical SAM protein [Candidatus Woesearchaeota archaeon]MBT7926970.1 radical SAM protein [Candidatus Woesearchaeota archaeon]